MLEKLGYTLRVSHSCFRALVSWKHEQRLASLDEVSDTDGLVFGLSYVLASSTVRPDWKNFQFACAFMHSAFSILSWSTRSSYLTHTAQLCLNYYSSQ